MHFLNSTFTEFSQYIKTHNLNIILFGNGAICKTVLPYVAEQYNFTNRISYIIDNNPDKQGSIVTFNSISVPVTSIEILEQLQDDYCVLITNGDFYSVVSALNTIPGCGKVPCFIAAYMLYGREYDKNLNHVFRDTSNAVIPKIIHYCWFSGNPIPTVLQECIRSWREQCPDYEIVQWNEHNIDLDKYTYTKEAHELKRWGFIPDIIRLDLLYEIGGFYFDTDVRIIKNLDPLRYQNAFCGRERAGHVNFGGGSGAVKGSPVIKKILDFRRDVPFVLSNSKLNTEASGFYETTPLMEMGLKLEDVNQQLDGINVYASEFFSPRNYVNGEMITNQNTFSIHYFSGSWLAGGEKLREETRKRYYLFKKTLETL